jgi:hypothetical protein
MIAERIHQIADTANLQAAAERLIEVLRGTGVYDNDEIQQLPNENQELPMPGGFPQDRLVSSNIFRKHYIHYIDLNFSIRT